MVTDAVLRERDRQGSGARSSRQAIGGQPRSRRAPNSKSARLAASACYSFKLRPDQRSGEAVQPPLPPESQPQPRIQLQKPRPVLTFFISVTPLFDCDSAAPGILTLIVMVSKPFTKRRRADLRGTPDYFATADVLECGLCRGRDQAAERLRWVAMRFDRLSRLIGRPTT